MDKNKLKELVQNMENEIKGLNEHGDIPHDSYETLTSILKEIKEIAKKEV